MNIIEKVFNIILKRRENPKENSYVSKMQGKGLDAILKKIGEEAGEVVIASKGGIKNEIIHEIADLWFHTLLVLEFHGLTPEDIYSELERRHKGD
jgi:phosphoribosyl-ATP pyrophosphohydrolase/phosphoribosyl-AMP cyclohydrolase